MGPPRAVPRSGRTAAAGAAGRLWAAIDRARAEAIEAEHTRLLGLVAGGRPLAECLTAATDAVTRFAEQSNGTLEIESAPGRGTTVRLWLPVAEAV